MSDLRSALVAVLMMLCLVNALVLFGQVGAIVDKCGTDYAVHHWSPCKAAR